MTNHAGNEPTAEQILWELYPDDVMDHNRRANCHLFLEQLRTHGLLSEGAPSEEQIKASAAAVDEDALAEVIEAEIEGLRHETRLYPDIYKAQVARAVAEWLKGQER